MQKSDGTLRTTIVLTTFVLFSALVAGLAYPSTIQIAEVEVI